ncbi:MAG TPA: O-antigen ligase family protein [Epulopiscium sp.]|nr:O-antigen ligase family protein [Candidatus Epulonipiscium sp.]
MNDYTTHEGKKSKVLWPLAIILAIVPLVVRLLEVRLPGIVKQFWDGGSGTYADFFSANKVILLGIATLIGVILFIVEYKKASSYQGTKLEIKLYKNKVVYSCLGVYTFFAIFSTIMTRPDERALAFFGAPGRYEGLVTILFYIISMVLAMYVGQEWWNIKAMYKIFAWGAFALGLIGIGQFFGIDLFQLDGGKVLILPHKYLHLAGQVNFSFDGRVYATLFNPNYVGSYGAMLMPISIVAMFYTYLYKKDTMTKLGAIFFALTMVALWITCYSRGGVVGGSFALLLIFILLGRKIIKNKTQWILLAILMVVSGIALNMLSEGVIVNRIRTLPKETMNFFRPTDSELGKLEDVKLEENAVEITSNLPFVRIEKQGEVFTLKDELGKTMLINEDEKNIRIEGEAFEGFVIVKKAPDAFMVRILNPEKGVNYYLDFVQTDDGFRIVGTNGALQTIEPVDAWGFEGKEKVGSGRGYIWSRTLPMVKDTWLYGYGPDTYVVRFPQHDVLGKINSGGTPRIVVDKPHNLYLQTMVSTGLVSLLALLVLFITYCILWFRHIRSLDQDDIRRWMSIGIFAAICGYLIAGLFNDSVVSVAPVFWILWGLGIGLTGSKQKV